MAGYRQIHTKIWTDEWFLDLPSAEKLLFIYLFSNSRTNLIGVYDLPVKVIVFETGLDREFIEATLQKFERTRKIAREGGLIWVVKMLDYNAQNATSPKIQPHIKASFRDVPNCRLKTLAIGHYNGLVPPQYRIDTVSYPPDTGPQEPYNTDPTDTDKNPPSVRSENAEPENAEPVPPSAAPTARTFQNWHADVQKAKGNERPGVLRAMFEALYPGRDPPDYGYIGRVAKEVGGAGRLAELFWQNSTRPPTGDVLNYCLRVGKNGKNGGGYATTGRRNQELSNDEKRAAAEQLAGAIEHTKRLLAADDG